MNMKCIQSAISTPEIQLYISLSYLDRDLDLALKPDTGEAGLCRVDLPTAAALVTTTFGLVPATEGATVGSTVVITKQRMLRILVTSRIKDPARCI